MRQAVKGRGTKQKGRGGELEMVERKEKGEEWEEGKEGNQNVG